MDETPEEWLERLFEYEFCAECGGDAEDHEVCIVPGIGNYFARCKRTVGEAVREGEPHEGGNQA
jgi:hypothetical protein